MRALVYAAPREFGVQEVPRPRAGAGEVVVDVQLAGVCGTDLHLHAGGFFAEFPLTPGHESVGIVREVGSGVQISNPASGWQSTTPRRAGTAHSARRASTSSARTSCPWA